MVSGSALLMLLVQLVIVGLIVWVLLWAIDSIVTTEPFHKVARVLVILFAVVYLINLLLGLGGHPFFRW